MVDVIIVPTVQSKGTFDNEFNDDKQEKLLIGASDKNLELSKGGERIKLSPELFFSDNGYLKIPTTEGELLLQWRLCNIQANQTVEFSFPLPYKTKCLAIVGSHRNNDHPVTVSADVVDLTKFKVTITGGLSAENIQIVSIGL